MTTQLHQFIELPPLHSSTEVSNKASSHAQEVSSMVRNDTGIVLLQGTVPMTVSKLTAEHMPTFKQKYAELTAKGIFRPRTSQEMQIVESVHYLFVCGKTVIGGFSLIEDGPLYLEFALVWTNFAGSGIGKHIVAEAKKLAHAAGKTLYALTGEEKVAMKCFVPAGFTYKGTVNEAKSGSYGDSLPPHVSSYDTTSRNPHYLIFDSHE